MRTKHALWLMGCLVVVAGCNKGTTPVAVPATPDGTATAVIAALSEDQPRVVWDCLPPSYQKDVQGLIQKFAGKVDAELYDKSFAVLGKAAKLLRDKKDYILEHPAAGSIARDKAKLSPAWDQLVAALDALVSSEIKTVDGLKKMDPGSFLATTGTKLFKAGRQISAASEQDPFAAMLSESKKTTITVVSTEGDSAVLKIEVPGKPTQEEKMTKVDGKWLPSALVSTWQNAISDANRNIDSINLTDDNKKQALGVLNTIEQTVDQLAAAKTKEEFNQQAGRALGTMMMFGGAMQGPQPGDSNGFPTNQAIDPGDAQPDFSQPGAAQQDDIDAINAEIRRQADDAAKDATESEDTSEAPDTESDVPEEAAK